MAEDGGVFAAEPPDPVALADGPCVPQVPSKNAKEKGMKFTQAEYAAYQARRAERCSKPRMGAAPTVEGVETESELHADIQAECRRRGWLCVHSRMDKHSHTACGVPDFIIWTGRTIEIEDANIGTIHVRQQPLLIEAKRRLGKLTTAQQAWHAHARKLGLTVHVVRSMAEFLKLI